MYAPFLNIHKNSEVWVLKIPLRAPFELKFIKSSCLFALRLLQYHNSISVTSFLTSLTINNKTSLV